MNKFSDIAQSLILLIDSKSYICPQPQRTLKQYGYPPDMEALAKETVLKQAEMIADELQLT